MSPRRRLAIVVAAVVGAVAVASWTGLTSWSGAPVTSPLTIAEVDVTNRPDVSLVVTAPSELIDTDLTKAFSLTEDGDRRDVLVERVPSDDLAVVLAIDTSGSMKGEPIEAAKSAAATFVQTLPAGTPVSLLGFSSDAAIALPFTTDRALQVASIQQLRASGDTVLYDALAAGGAALAGTSSTRRALVILSDGEDTISHTGIDNALTALHESGVRASVLELVSPEGDHAALAHIADVTKGRLVSAKDASGVSEAYRAITADLLGQYRISYRSFASGPTPVGVGLATGSIDARATTRLELPSGPSSAAPGFLASDSALALGAVCLFVALLVGFGLALGPRSRRVSASRLGHLQDPRVPARAGSVGQLAERATELAERRLDKSGRRGGLDALLEQGGLAVRAGEVVVITGAGAFAAFALGVLLSGVLLGMLLAGSAVLGVRIYLGLRRARRQAAFAEQMDDMLQIIASSLRSGYGLLQAIETGAQEMESPMADELRRLTTEVRLGRDLADGLSALAARVANEDFEWVAQAIRVHREVGGDLAEVLDHVAQTIRARNSLARQVKALSAEGKMSAYVLLALPFVIGGLMTVINPTYVGELFVGFGLALLGLGVVLMALGAFWLSRIVRPNY